MSAKEQIGTLNELRGRLLPHRKSDPAAADHDTFVMRPRILQVAGREVIAWDVAQRVTVRTEARYNPDRDELSVRMIDTNSVRYATFVSVPSLGVLAVSDKAGEMYLGAAAGVARFKSVFRSGVPGGEVDVVLAASRADVRRALSEWSLSRFTFTVRPFNPHPREPGKKLSELFERDGIGQVTGQALPAPGERMHMEQGGYIEETVGLADAGYGQFGVQGRTPEGREAALKKPGFNRDKAKNEKAQAAPQQLRVFIEPQENELQEVQEAAKALLEFYDIE